MSPCTNHKCSLFDRRVWVIQEVAVALEVTVHCGDQALSWDHLDAVITARVNSIGSPETHAPIFSWPLGSTLCNTKTQENIKWSSASAIQMARRRFQTARRTRIANNFEIAGGDQSLGTFLCPFRSFKCSDPRDKIYGVLSLSITPTIFPNYNKTKEIVYREVTQACIEQGSLAILSMVDFKNRNPKLPSYVPDFKRDEQPEGTPFYKPSFNSCGSTKVEVEFVNSVMRIQGCYLDTISAIVILPNYNCEAPDLIGRLESEVIKQQKLSNSPFNSRTERRNALADTVGILSLGYLLKWFKGLQVIGSIAETCLHGKSNTIIPIGEWL
jgi:hypothetical protein